MTSPHPKPVSPPKPRSRKPALGASPAPREGERLAKRVQEQVGCSRREAEQYIEGGWVSVNGQVVEEPMHRVSDQRIEIDPEASLMELQPVTLLLHKPPGYDAVAGLGEANARVKPAWQLLQVANHVADDPAGVRVLKRHLNKLEATVPLETGAGGLVVFTQDWRVARKLNEDAGVLEQELIVEVAGEVAPAVLERLQHMKSASGQPLPGFKVSLNSNNEQTSKLRFAVKGVHLGLIAFLCERVGLTIVGMRRMRIARVSMTQLPVGQWRYLQAHERF